MPAVVLDTNVLLPGLLSPRGYRRRLLVVLALGALAAHAEALRSLAATMPDEATSTGGTVGGTSLEELAATAGRRAAALRERLPHGCPDHWRLVASRPILDEYVRKLRDVGMRIEPSLSGHDIATLGRVVRALCSDVSVDVDAEALPRYCDDRSDDAFVHTALLAKAAWLVSHDRHVARDHAGSTEYRLPDSHHGVAAVTFSRFLEHLTDVDLDEVDPQLLPAALSEPEDR